MFASPVPAPPAVRTLATILAIAGTLLLLGSMGTDWWYVVEGEASVVTGTDTVNASDPIALFTVLGGLTAAAWIAFGVRGRRSFAGLALVVAWFSLGAAWMGYTAADFSSRSYADLRIGLWLGTAATITLTGAALMASIGRVVTRHRRRHARWGDGGSSP